MGKSLKVQKRNKTVVDFDMSKIKSAIQKAFDATKTNYTEDILDFITLKITAEVTKKCSDNILHIEDIQDAAERVLSLSGYEDVAKAYILYRKDREKLRNANASLLNYKKTMDDYLHVKDWRVKENSTVGYSLGGLILSNSGAMTANYWLSEVYDEEIANAHRNADLHIHDLSMLSPYCFTGDTKVQTLDGKNPSFKEMVDSGIKELDVFAYDVDNQMVVIGKAKNPHITRQVNELVKITLSTNEIIECTVDHPIMLQDGTYLPAKDLKSNMSLKALPVHEKINIDSLEEQFKRLYLMRLNHKVRHNSNLVKGIEKIHLDSPVDVYDMEVENYHNFALDCGVFVHNCAGWSLKQLVQEGLGGVSGKITSKPAKHLAQLCNQMVNFIGILQNEWAGAQAFSSFDTYLAPFVREDNLSYDEVKHCIESLIFGLNTPSRWGCVSEDTEVLTTLGFKKYSELQKGDLIYVWNYGKLEVNPVREIVVKPYKGKMHEYKSISGKYLQFVSPDHRVLCKDPDSDDFVIRHSNEIFDSDLEYKLPTKFLNSDLADETGLTEDEIRFAAIMYSNGIIHMNDDEIIDASLIHRIDKPGNDIIPYLSNKLGLHYYFVQDVNEKGHTVNKFIYYGDDAKRIVEIIGITTDIIDEKFFKLNANNATLFLQTWNLLHGSSRKNHDFPERIRCKNDGIATALQHIALRSGRTSSIYRRTEKNPLYVFIKNCDTVLPIKKEKDYDGIIWCPNVDAGTAVFRKDGCVFISGQCQAPFSNITIDWTCPSDLAELNCIVGGKELPYTYKDCKKEMDMINKAFLEVMIEGDANGRGFQYPIPTYSITKEFDWSDTENNRLLFEMTAKYGTPYFSNYINSDLDPSQIRSMCCRLRLELRELARKNGGFFGSGESTGSVGVVTLNMPRLAYLSENEKDFYIRLEKLMDIAARSLHVKRKVLTQYMENGLYPYTKHYLGSFHNHFSTIGLVGMNEACRNAKWIRKDLTHEESQIFTKNVLNFMRNKLSDYQEQYPGELFNLEATPAESTAYRLAKHDKEKYPDIITAAKSETDTPYYTNSSHLPVNYTEDIFSALDIQDELQVLYTSGTVFHGFLGEKLSDWHSAAALVRKIAENYKLPYFTLSPTYSICKNHGYIAGEEYACPECGKSTEVYSRITGYYRPVQNWNDGKKAEFEARKTYNVEGLAQHLEEHEMFECEECKIDIPEDIPPVMEDYNEIPVLYTTSTCPNCKMAKAKMEKNGILFEVVNCTEHPEYAREKNVKQAPTLFADGQRYTGVKEVMDWINAHI